MSSEPTLVDELWESLVAVVVAAAAGVWWLLRRPWLLGAALIAIGVVAAGELPTRRFGGRMYVVTAPLLAMLDGAA